METLLSNIPWMLVNILLAVLPVYAGWLFLGIKKWYVKAFFATVWLFFVPNAAYILTDLKHISGQLQQVDGGYVLWLLIQYFILTLIGIICYILALFPIEQVLHKKHVKKLPVTSLLFFMFLHFIISFGVTMGRFMRTNSWEVVTNTERVILDAWRVLTTPELLLFVLLFGVICNALYFFFRIPIQTLFLILVDDHKRHKR